MMFLIFAMTTDAVGSVIPRIIQEFRLSMTAAGAFHYAPMAAIAVGALLLGFLADRLGRKKTIVVGLLLYAVGSGLFALGNSFGFFLALLALSGLGISIFKIGALALIGDIAESTSSHTSLMNTLEGFFGVGSIIGPAIVITLLNAGLSWKWLYEIAAVICVVLIVLALIVRYPGARHVEREKVQLRQTFVLMRETPRTRIFNPRGRLRFCGGGHLRMDANLPAGVSGSPSVVVDLCADHLLCATGRRSLFRRMVVAARVVDSGACAVRLCDLRMLRRQSRRWSSGGSPVTAAVGPLHVNDVSDTEFQGDQLLSQVESWRDRRSHFVLHGGRRGTGPSGDGCAQRRNGKSQVRFWIGHRICTAAFPGPTRQLDYGSGQGAAAGARSS